MASKKLIEEPSTALVCATCIGESFLSELVAKGGKPGLCAFCSKSGSCISVEELSEHIETAFERHYVRTPEDPGYGQDRAGTPVLDAIADAAHVSDDIAAQVCVHRQI